MKYGIQMYSVRDVTPTDMEGALRALSEMGYSYVEFAGFFDHPAEVVKGWLEKYGLEAIGTHTRWKQIRDCFDEVVAYHKTIGCKEIIVPSADLTTLEGVENFVNFVADAAPRLAKEGLRLSYHNHDREFRVMEYGTMAHSELQRRTDMSFEIDTYWVYRAGLEPLRVLRELEIRIPLIHLKDGLADGTGKPLGMGTAPVEAVWNYARAKGLPMVVESETLTPSGLAEAEICIRYLRGLEAKAGI